MALNIKDPIHVQKLRVKTMETGQFLLRGGGKKLLSSGSIGHAMHLLYFLYMLSSICYPRKGPDVLLTLASGENASWGAMGEIKHLVVVKFKEGVMIEEIIKGMEKLVSEVDLVKSFEWGEDTEGPEMLTQGFTHSFSMTFDKKEDYAAFQSHPNHVEYSAAFSAAIEKIAVLLELKGKILKRLIIPAYLLMTLKILARFHPQELNCSHYSLEYRSSSKDDDYKVYELGTRISFGIPHHVPDICNECQKPNATLKIVFLTLVGLNVDFAEDKVISMAGSTKPNVNILSSALP
ncbi:hypothetical protein D5086_009246 [Populus alba]|uniref:Uncharacterized protein n=1 Tax=Populus alba TaxID=43335 RepID=A0ACC4CJ65_POPAL